MLQRNGQIPNGTILHQMVHSTSSTTPRTRGLNKKRTISESSDSESECEYSTFIIHINHLLLVTQSISTIADYEDQLDRSSKDLISTIHKAYKETIEVKHSTRNISNYYFLFNRIYPFVKIMVIHGYPV
jgi:hypothetical protein